MVRGPFLQDTTEGEFVLELEVLRAEEDLFETLTELIER